MSKSLEVKDVKQIVHTTIIKILASAAYKLPASHHYCPNTNSKGFILTPFCITSKCRCCRPCRLPTYHSFSTIVCTSIPKVPFNRLSNRTQRNQVTVPWKDGIKQLLDRLKAVNYITSYTERAAAQQNDGSRQDEKSNSRV